MTEPERLKRLLDLYSRVMGDFVRTRLYQRFGAKWWDDGVLASLDSAQRAAIRSQQTKSPDRDRMQLLGPAHIAAIILRNFDTTFAASFPEGKERVRALAEAVNRARIKLANNQPLTDSQARASLQAMAQLLRSAGYAREATAVEAAAPR